MGDPIRASGTVEAVAYVLMQDVMEAEGKTNHGATTGLDGKPTTRADRTYLLDLYAECVTAAKGQRNMNRGSRPG